jgi:hypothetical protein
MHRLEIWKAKSVHKHLNITQNAATLEHNSGLHSGRATQTASGTLSFGQLTCHLTFHMLDSCTENQWKVVRLSSETQEHRTGSHRDHKETEHSNGE